MFTGIIEQVATVKELKKTLKGGLLVVSVKDFPQDIKIGESIAVNGACLTVTGLYNNNLSFDIMTETLKRTNLIHLKSGASVNIERALRLSDRLSGHILTGHIDGTGIIKQINAANDLVLSINASDDITKYLAPKGQVAIDGISLTLVEIKKNLFTVHVIPHTLKATNLNSKSAGDPVNIEVDIFAKYISRYIDAKNSSKITKKQLTEHGFI